jgi:hypothetical protein
MANSLCQRSLLVAAVVAMSCFSANFASAQQMPTEFLDMMASNKLKLTPEQAIQITGFYNKTEIIRLEGSTVDHALKAALEAAAASGNNNSTIDYANVTAQALKDSDTIREYSFWIPHIDPESGFFYGYRVLKSSGNESFPAVKRFIGAAMARPDGSVLLVASNDQDTAIWQGVYRNDTIYLSYMEGTELWDATGTKLLEDQTVFSAVMKKVEVPERFMAELKDALPLHVNEEVQSTASSAGTAAASGAVGGVFAALLAVFYAV